jgi:hypothetical protein
MVGPSCETEPEFEISAKQFETNDQFRISDLLREKNITHSKQPDTAQGK